MLQPTNRLTLLDALAPPVGLRLESAMAVTFTLDLRALLAAPAALALSGPDGIVSDGSGQEPIELLHALRAHAGSLTVFCQAGEIALPPAQRVFAFLERAVIPATAPRGGIVHPKVWVLRYEPPDGPPSQRRLRVLVASRNLTFDHSWDALVRLDEANDGGASLAPVGDLFEGLLDCAVDAVSAEHTARVESLAAALRTARFALPAGVDDLRAHVLGLSEAPSPLPAASARSLIVSPFVAEDFFTRVHPVPVDELVSKPEQLDGLDPATRQKSAALFVFDDGSLADLQAEETDASPHDPGRPLVGLHAKLFAFETAGRAHLFVGSANATGAAFGRNVEILLEVGGTLEALGIDRLCGGSDDEPSLRDFFVPYRGPQDEPPSPPGEGTLDGARRAMARLAFTGTVEASGTGWAVTYRTTEPLSAPARTDICCWPLASPGNRRQVTAGEPLEARFETTLEAMSGFLAFELTHKERESTRFVIPVRLDGVPEERDRRLLRALLGNAERFFRYLLALLDDDPGEISLLEAVEGRSPADGAGPAGPLSAPVLEKLLRTMRRDPAKLDGLHPLVADLAADEALPAGFAELWEMIHDVAQTEAQKP
ncbi:MAG: hypothetical protein F4078_08355 [Acidimicrobiia bacterium]|nr:hypothetical protein [Acidimicrobiia bacterium]MYB25653.1 hypothetical protein [Acidimicrobiia bacterium]MYJ14294.1 hypothetical protein [Acidimicrobiia bacterium]